MGDGGCFRGGAGVVIVLRDLVAMGVAANALPEGCGLLLQGVCLRALFGESGEANALLGCGGVLEEVSLRLKGQATLGVGGAQGSSLIFQLLGGGECLVAELGCGGGIQGTGGGGGGHGCARATANRGARAGAGRGERTGGRERREERRAQRPRGRVRLGNARTRLGEQKRRVGGTAQERASDTMIDAKG